MTRFLQIVFHPFRREGTLARGVLLVLAVALIAADHLGYLANIQASLSSPALTLKLDRFVFTPYGVIKVIFIVAVILMVSAALTRTLENWLTRVHGFNSSNRELIIKVVQILSAIVIFFVTLDALKIDLTALAFLGGGIGIGLGFGLQKIASNFFSGIILLMEKSMRLNDVIELPGGTWGTIKHIGGRYTLVETSDSKELIVPNEDLITGHVTNWTYSNTRARISVEVGVAYGTDLEVAKQCILNAATQYEHCSMYPEPAVYLREFGNSSITFLMYFWIDDVHLGRFKAQSDVMFAIWHKFKQHGIEMPFPQRDIHIRSMPGTHSLELHEKPEAKPADHASAARHIPVAGHTKTD